MLLSLLLLFYLLLLCLYLCSFWLLLSRPSFAVASARTFPARFAHAMQIRMSPVAGSLVSPRSGSNKCVCRPPDRKFKNPFACTLSCTRGSTRISRKFSRRLKSLPSPNPVAEPFPRRRTGAGADKASFPTFPRHFPQDANVTKHKNRNRIFLFDFGSECGTCALPTQGTSSRFLD